MTDTVYKILIVDDEEMNLKLLSRFLSCGQYTLYTAGSGKEAVELAKKIGPDLVLLDVLMPELDGVETCRILKSSEGTSHIPVIMVTACTDMDTRLRCLRAGANDFLAKPVDDVELQLRVNNLLEFRRHADTRKWNALLEQSKAELQKKNADLEQFLYTASHDLRTPLVTVKTFLGYLAEDMADNNQERVAQDLQFIHGAADKMKLLLDELLDMARIDRVATLPVRVSLKELLGEVLDILAGIINTRKVDIHLPDTDLVLLGDRLELFRIWQNLIENAIKYSCNDSARCIELDIQQMNGEKVFCVKDNGIGIDPQYRTKIFGIFEKLDPKSAGAGVGLSMAQRIVEKCGGRIWVESKGIGKGSCFFFTLPHAVLQS